MPTFFSPTGNPEVWEEKPDGYFISEEWQAAHPPEPEPEPTFEELQQQYTDIIQNRLDDFARTKTYDNILSAASYVNSTIPVFQAEGKYAVAARDATWLKANEILNDVKEGKRSLPTIDEVLAELPVLAWPE